MTREEFDKRFEWVHALNQKQKIHCVTSIMGMLMVPEVMFSGFLENMKAIIEEENKK